MTAEVATEPMGSILPRTVVEPIVDVTMGGLTSCGEDVPDVLTDPFEAEVSASEAEPVIIQVGLGCADLVLTLDQKKRVRPRAMCAKCQTEEAVAKMKFPQRKTTSTEANRLAFIKCQQNKQASIDYNNLIKQAGQYEAKRLRGGGGPLPELDAYALSLIHEKMQKLFPVIDEIEKRKASRPPRSKSIKPTLPTIDENGKEDEPPARKRKREIRSKRAEDHQ